MDKYFSTQYVAPLVPLRFVNLTWVAIAIVVALIKQALVKVSSY